MISSKHSIITISSLIVTSICSSFAFSPSFIQPSHSTRTLSTAHPRERTHRFPPKRSHPHPRTTSLHNGIIIDVDDNFFTATFFSIGLFYSLGRAYNRYLLEEVAFEQRKLEAREKRLEEDPAISEFELRREESEGWTSVYGRRRRSTRDPSGAAEERENGWGSSRVAVLDREEEDEEYGMTDEEISEFESRYGVEYDPYYDEPYEESELPEGKFKEDKSYGDRRYANGEVFYKDEATGLFYRQGSRPRQKKFWDFNSF